MKSSIADTIDPDVLAAGATRDDIINAARQCLTPDRLETIGHS